MPSESVCPFFGIVLHMDGMPSMTDLATDDTLFRCLEEAFA